jgi:hypothetical protein
MYNLHTQVHSSTMEVNIHFVCKSVHITLKLQENQNYSDLERKVIGSISGRVKPKTVPFVFAVSLLSICMHHSGIGAIQVKSHLFSP